MASKYQLLKVIRTLVNLALQPQTPEDDTKFNPILRKIQTLLIEANINEN